MNIHELITRSETQIREAHSKIKTLNAWGNGYKIQWLFKDDWLDVTCSPDDGLPDYLINAVLRVKPEGVEK